MVEVFRAINFARGVAKEGDLGFFGCHTVSIIGDFDEGSSGVGKSDRDLGCSGVEGVFDEFLDGGGGSLDDFSGGDLVDRVVIQEPDGRKVGRGEGGGTHRLSFHTVETGETELSFWGKWTENEDVIPRIVAGSCVELGQSIMFAFVGIIVGIVCTLLGYVLHHGNIAVLIQPTEFIIIFGAALGIFIGSFGMKTFTATIKAVIGLLKAPPTKEHYVELLKMMYELFNVARKEGLLGLEQHVEKPDESAIISKYPSFLGNHHAVHFMCDTLKVILTGAVGPHDLSEMMEMDLEISHEEEHRPAEALQTVGDAMPAVGIVAAVLGVIITMGKINEGPEKIGASVAAALVGTFLGIFVGYVVCAPLSKSILNKIGAEGMYMNCIRHALFSFARGESPITCVEFARRQIEPGLRPGFVELEEAVKAA